MAKEVINTGASPNDGSGDPIRTAFNKVVNNFNEMYSSYEMTGKLTAGNSTVNTTISNTGGLVASNTVSNVVANSSIIRIANTTGTTTMLPTSITVGSNVIVNSSAIFIGNSTVNATVNSTIYSGTANNTNFFGSVSAANVVSNAQLSANLSNYQTTAGLAANVATLTANNTSFVGSIDAANVVSNAQLSANLSNYQTTADLVTNVAALTANNATHAFSKLESALNVNAALNAFNANNLGGVGPTSYVNTSGAYTLSGNLTFSGVTVYQSNVTLNAGLIANGSVGTAGQVLFSNGSTGSPYWVSLTAASTNLDAQYAWTNTQTFSNTITFNSQINVGSNVGINTSAIFVGNSTSNLVITSTSIAGNISLNNVIITGNLTVNGTVTTVNTSTLDVADINITIAKNATDAATANGAGLTINGANATIRYISDSNNFVFSQFIEVGNSTTNSTINTTSFTGSANNTSFVGSVSAANVVSNAQLSANLGNYQTTAGLVANVATLTANNTSFVGSVAVDNVVSNAQLSANLSNYQTIAGLSANVAVLTANNTSFVGSVSAANVVSNAQLSANLSNYQTTAGLSANVATLTANNTSFVGSVQSDNVVSNAQLSANLGNYQTTAGLSDNVAVLTANNANNLGGVAAASYVNTSGSYTLSGNLTFSANILYQSNVRFDSGLIANGTIGTAGQILLSNGSTGSPYWGNAAFAELSDTSDLTVDRIYMPAATMLNVTNDGASAYRFDQYGTTNNPSINASSDTTIAFNLNVTGHPFLIQTSAGSNYNDGLTHVSTSGVVTTGSSAQGKVSGTLYWKIPEGTLGNYRYQCSIHGGMVGVIAISAKLSVETAASTYQTTAGLSANVATLTANNTSFVGSVSAANVVSNAQLSANLGNYQTTADLSGNVAILTANNANNLGGVAAASYVQNTDSRTLSGNLVISGTEFNPSSNTVLLGNSTQRWVLSANTIDTRGLSVNGTSFFYGNSSFQNTSSFQQVIESFSNKTGATSVVAHDYLTGSAFLHSSIASNFTANFTNVPVEDNKIVTFALILNQGATGYFANAVQINGSAATVKFSGGAAPTPTASVIELQTVSLIRNAGAWIVLSALNPYA